MIIRCPPPVKGEFFLDFPQAGSSYPQFYRSYPQICFLFARLRAGNLNVIHRETGLYPQVIAPKWLANRKFLHKYLHVIPHNAQFIHMFCSKISLKPAVIHSFCLIIHKIEPLFAQERASLSTRCCAQFGKNPQTFPTSAWFLHILSSNSGVLSSSSSTPFRQFSTRYPQEK